MGATASRGGRGREPRDPPSSSYARGTSGKTRRMLCATGRAGAPAGRWRCHEAALETAGMEPPWARPGDMENRAPSPYTAAMSHAAEGRWLVLHEPLACVGRLGAPHHREPERSPSPQRRANRWQSTAYSRGRRHSRWTATPDGPLTPRRGIMRPSITRALCCIARATPRKRLRKPPQMWSLARSSRRIGIINPHSSGFSGGEVQAHTDNLLHIPSDLVVDQWASVSESSSHRDYLFLHGV